MVADRSFISMLAGGKRQSIGGSNAVAQQVQDQTELAAKLWEAILFADRLLDDPSRIVQANALEGVVRLADVYAEVADLASAVTPPFASTGATAVSRRGPRDQPPSGASGARSRGGYRMRREGCR